MAAEQTADHRIPLKPLFTLHEHHTLIAMFGLRELNIEDNVNGVTRVNVPA